jgi:hypothetical protein
VGEMKALDAGSIPLVMRIRELETATHGAAALARTTAARATKEEERPHMSRCDTSSVTVVATLFKQ